MEAPPSKRVRPDILADPMKGYETDTCAVVSSGDYPDVSALAGPGVTSSTPIKLVVQKLGGDPSPINVQQDITLGDLERVIAKAENLSDEVKIALVLGDQKLEACMKSLTLSQIGIREGATLTLFIEKTAQVLTASKDGTAKIWDTSTGECKRTLTGHHQHLTSAVFSADGSKVLTASWDQTAKIWDASTGECEQTLSGHNHGVVSAVFSADGSEVLTASLNNAAKIWDASTGECKRTLTGHFQGLRSAAFSADGSEVITASEDDTARIWNASTGECTQTLIGHSGCLVSAVFSVA